MVRLILLIAALILARSTLAAQAPDTLPIDTDRPDFTDGTHTLPRGHTQLEAGYTYQQERGEGAPYTHSFPEALIRIGVLQWAELRIGQNYLVQNPGSGAGDAVRGFDDIYLGTKVSLADARGIAPAVSLEAKVNLPSGTDGISAKRILPGAAILLGWEGSGPLSAGVEGYVTQSATGNAQGVASLSVQYQLATRWQLYGEVFTQQAAGDDASPENYANSGVLLLITRTVQIDARLGIGLDHAADRFFAGFGFAIRR